MKEHLETTTSIQPRNNNVLVKIVTRGYPVVNVMSGSKAEKFDGAELYVAGTSVEDFKIGDRILLPAFVLQDTNNVVYDGDNKNSFPEIQSLIKSLTPNEYQSLIKKLSKVDIVSYIIVNANTITAVVDKNKNNEFDTKSSIEAAIKPDIKIAKS